MTTMAKIPKTTIKKLDKPRPLKMNKVLEKTQPDCVDIAEEIINLADSCSQKIQSSHLDQPTIAFQINTLWNSLKTFGPHLERVYKDRLDRAFVVFRNGSRDERLDQRSRLSLLELIELRAINWNSNDYMTTFYKQRQLDEMTIDAINSPTPSTPPMLGLSGQSLLQATVQSPPILNPGEVIRASGKFTKPTKIPGKNYSKDEVIIRNSDSGKVMGIKGRRVHMIEELSETIISFQRVNPGARERLVQITGPNEDKITYAKQLIEDTIRRNASPVREIQEKERICGSSSSLNSSASDDETYNHSGHHRSLQHSHSAHSNLEYKYTVVVGKQTIKIIGNDYNIVKIAKVILDEHLMTEVQKSKDMEDYASIISFEEDPFVANHEEFKEEIPTNSRIEEDPYIKEKDLTPAIANDMLNKTGGASAVGRSLLFASLQTPTRPPGEIKQMILPKLPLTPNQDVSRNDVYPKDMKSRRSFSTSTTITNVVKRLPYVYTTEQLKQFSEHPICKRQPANWLKIISEIPEISRKVVQSKQAVFVQAFWNPDLLHENACLNFISKK